MQPVDNCFADKYAFDAAEYFISSNLEFSLIFLVNYTYTQSNIIFVTYFINIKPSIKVYTDYLLSHTLRGHNMFMCVIMVISHADIMLYD